MALKPGERVVVVGCGPVGMVLTLALYRVGIPVTLIEKNDVRSTIMPCHPAIVAGDVTTGVTGEIHERG